MYNFKVTRKPIPKKLREAVKNRFGGNCGYCGTYPKTLHIDHIVPITRAHMEGDGFDPHSEKNLMPACPSCNNYKHGWTVEEFRRELQEQVKRARKMSVNFRLAERYRMIRVESETVTFLFERYDHNMV